MALNQKHTLDPAYLEKLQDYYAEHKVIPSYSVLASLWGVSAKSWVAECVKRFEEAGYLDWTPDRQLKPGKRFFERVVADSPVQAGMPSAALSEGYDFVDRKSTRLNSSHLVISYAVFCLKKKKKTYTLVSLNKKKKKKHHK